MSTHTLAAAALLAGALALPVGAAAKCGVPHTVATNEPEVRVTTPAPQPATDRPDLTGRPDLQAKATVDTTAPSTAGAPEAKTRLP
jgi:hypothetical protein